MIMFHHHNPLSFTSGANPTIVSYNAGAVKFTVYNGSSSLSRFKSKKNVSFPLLKNALAQRCRRLERSFKVEENICFQNALATRGVVNHDCRIGS
jgi:hypothetical protein